MVNRQMFGYFGFCLDVLAYVWISWLMFDVSLDVLAYVWMCRLMFGCCALCLV